MVPSRTVENIANRILLSLPESSLKRLRHAFEFRTIAKNEPIDRLDQPIEYMHFVNRGLISFVKTMLDGRSVKRTHGETGTKRTSRLRSAMSAFGVKRTLTGRVPMTAFDPFQTSLRYAVPTALDGGRGFLDFEFN